MGVIQVGCTTGKRCLRAVASLEHYTDISGIHTHASQPNSQIKVKNSSAVRFFVFLRGDLSVTLCEVTLIILAIAIP